MPMGRTGDESGEEIVNDRMCIVSRRSLPSDALIRFVLDPEGAVVPDLKRRLPGRGAHVEAVRGAVETAVRRNLFRRAFRGEGRAGEELADTVDALLARQALGALGLARKAGQLATGAAKVEAELRGGRVAALLQALDGAPDGRRKMEAARHAAAASGRAGHVPVFRLFSADEMSLALGGANVVHAAVLAGSAGAALVSRLSLLENYRGEPPAETDDPASGAEQSSPRETEDDGRAGDGGPCTDEAPGQRSGQEAEA